MIAAVVALALGGCAGAARPVAQPSPGTRTETEEAALARRVSAYRDPRVVEYLTTVAARVRSKRGDDLPIAVIEDPTSAAFVSATGRLYVHSGLLSRLENEAELATILARELARWANGPAPGVGAGPALAGPLPRGDLSPTAAAILGLDLRHAAAAAITGYGAVREREADAEALRRLAAAGYDTGQAPRLFERLAGDPDRGPLEIFFYGNRARMRERYAAMRELVGAAETSRAAAAGGRRFEVRMSPVVRDNAALDLRAGRFGLAGEQLDRVLATEPRDAIAQAIAGDLRRLRSQRAATDAERAEDVRQATARYQRALELDPAYAEPLRQLGLLYYQERDIARARAAFERYLAAVPEAGDARRIREYLAVLGE